MRFKIKYRGQGAPQLIVGIALIADIMKERGEEQDIQTSNHRLVLVAILEPRLPYAWPCSTPESNDQIVEDG
jgi:hypothetical protein